MPKPTTHSQIAAMLQKQGISTHLTQPPREFLAVLSEEGSGRTVSLKFREPQTSSEFPGTPMVIHMLLAQYLGTKLVNGEYSDSTMEYFLEEQFKKGKTQAKIPGSQLRFITTETATAHRPTRGNSATPPWSYLTDKVSLQIFANDPFVVDNDPNTLEANLAEAVKALEQKIADQERIIIETQRQKKEAKETLNELDPLPTPLAH